MSGVQTLRVGEGEGEARLDRWLRRRFPHLTQGAIEKMCRKGELRVAGGRADLAGQALPVPGLADGSYQTGFRAPHLRLSPAHGALQFAARVDASEITGAETYLHLDVDGRRWTLLAEGVHPLAPDHRLTVWLDPAHVYLFDAGGRLARPAPYAAAA